MSNGDGVVALDFSAQEHQICFFLFCYLHTYEHI